MLLSLKMMERQSLTQQIKMRTQTRYNKQPRKLKKMSQGLLWLRTSWLTCRLLSRRWRTWASSPIVIFASTGKKPSKKRCKSTQILYKTSRILENQFQKCNRSVWFYSTSKCHGWTGSRWSRRSATTCRTHLKLRLTLKLLSPNSCSWRRTCRWRWSITWTNST